MPLPSDNNEQWPPKEWSPIYAEYAEHDAWYSGDPNRIAQVHAGRVGTPTEQGRFWAKEIKDERRTMLHVPVAGDIAAYSADLLFSEKPVIKVPGAHDESGDPAAKKAQERLDNVIEDGAVFRRLHESGETCAAMGGVVLKPAWDREIADYPILSIAQVDNALPEFRHGILSGLTLWKEIETDGATTWRLLERYEPNGQILTGLYKGTPTTLGRQFPLTYREDTRHIQPIISTGYKGVAARYVANMLPNRRFRGKPIGQSDFSGVEQLMDALDEVYSSWMRDIRLGKGRILVPEDWLEFDQAGKTSFDIDKEVFAKLNIAPGQDVQMTATQFEIRTEEHAKSALELLERIISHPGYSPQSFGLNIEGRAESGTALNSRERRSFKTGSKKQEYWKNAIEDVLFMMMMVDDKFLRSGVTPIRPTVEMKDSFGTDPMMVAQSIETLRRAKALSIDTAVRMAHPDWAEDQVQAEVKRIQEEDNTLPDPMQVGIA